MFLVAFFKIMISQILFFLLYMIAVLINHLFYQQVNNLSFFLAFYALSLLSPLFSVMSQWKMYPLLEEMIDKLNTDTVLNAELSLLDFFCLSLSRRNGVFFSSYWALTSLLLIFCLFTRGHL